ncbi:hypothetical protein [Hyphomicrobium sp. LHD-15]|uniref:hypothetical protein n=1 Tax=Hyphomicrobium sp. LHD-15 TaxID=3072142 RepID=UPI00280DCE70|nr:hypothetical protein [Hyphomicrobium sp. LHD-15]MDQ8700223.1 hypothetical protein [Hyphomicrobium sp. LHD-15]
MTESICGRRADFQHMDFGNPVLEREVAFEVGRAEERERIRAIVEHGAAAARPVTALALALETDLPAAAVSDLLGKLPIEPKADRLSRRGR